MDNIIFIFTVFGVVSLVSLCIVFLVYWVIPDFNNLHGKIVLGNVVSIFCVTSFLLTVFNFKLDDKNLCKFIGYFGYISSISMFSWMTIMCFDLSSTFIREEIPHPFNNKLRFVFYSIIGWGSGLVLAMVLLLFEHFLPPDSDFNPAVGTQSCFISKKGKTFLYLFHFPILVMMIINISFFIIVLIFLIKTNVKSSELRISRR